jgi:hypothetical protein
MFGSLISGIGQGATGFAGLAGAFDPDLPRRNMGTEVRTTLRQNAPIFKAAAKWQPRYEQLNRGVMQSSLFGGPVMANEQTPGYAEMLTNLFSYLGPRMMEAQRLTNPEAAAGLDALLKSAQEDFSSGYDLSPAELRNLQQGMRSAQAARGFGFSPADAGYESLAQLQAGQGLRQQRMGNLSSALSQHFAQTPNPFGIGQSLMGMGMGASQAAASRLVDPFNAYAADLHNTNFNAKAYEELATIQNRKEAAQNITAGAAAIGNAGMGGMGGMGGGMGGGIGGMMGGGGGSWFQNAPAYGQGTSIGMSPDVMSERNYQWLDSQAR